MGYLSRYYATTLFGIAVQGLAFPEPRPTDKVTIPSDAQSPIPTIPPDLHEFLRRQDAVKTARTVISATDNTCGYFDNRPGAALTCGGSASCVFVLSTAGLQGFNGCCNGDKGCNFLNACLDIKDALDPSICGNGCLMDQYTLKCTETSLSYCNTAKWFGGITQYFCGALAISTPQSIFTTYNNQVGRTMVTTVLIWSSETSSSSFLRPPRTSKPDTIVSSSEAPPSSTAPSPPPTSSAPSPQPQQSSSTPIGPIVGGAVGGVAVIGLIILGIVLLMRKKPPAPAPAPIPGPDSSPPFVFPATPMGGSPPPQNPADIKYGQEPMVQTYGAVPPQNNTQGYQQQYSPQSGQGYFAAAQQPQQQSPTDQTRISIAPPASLVSSMTSQQQQQGVAYQHLSQQSFASTQPGALPFQPGTTTAGYQHAPPPDVYEAGGYAVGGPTDLNADHRGQIHQLQ